MTRREWLAGFAFVPQFWNERRYSQWTAAETAALLSDSPWAHKSGTATVLWLSAAPVQMAMARERQGTLSVPSAPRRMKGYIILVSGLPASAMPNDRQARIDVLRDSKLSMRGSPALLADDVKITDDGLEYWFPGEVPITTSTKQVEFVTKLGAQTIRARFLPSQMLFEGQPAL